MARRQSRRCPPSPPRLPLSRRPSTTTSRMLQQRRRRVQTRWLHSQSRRRTRSRRQRRRQRRDPRLNQSRSLSRRHHRKQKALRRQRSLRRRRPAEGRNFPHATEVTRATFVDRQETIGAPTPKTVQFLRSELACRLNSNAFFSAGSQPFAKAAGIDRGFHLCDLERNRCNVLCTDARDVVAIGLF